MIKTAANKFIIIALGIITLVVLNFISMPASARSASINAVEPAPDTSESEQPGEIDTPAPDSGAPDTGETETPDITEGPAETPTAENTTDTPPEETETPVTTDAVTTETPPTEAPPTEGASTSTVPATDATTPEAATPTPPLEFLQDFTIPPFHTDASGNRTVPPDATPTRPGINASVGIVQVDIIENVEREFRWFDIILYIVDAMYILAVLAIVYGVVGLIGLVVFKKDISIAALKKHNKEKNKEKLKRGEKRK